MYLKLLLWTLRHLPLAICFVIGYSIVSYVWRKKRFPKETHSCLFNVIKYYTKFVIAYLVVGLKHWYIREDRIKYNNNNVWKAMFIQTSEAQKEKKNAKENDTVVMQGSDDQGNQLFVRLSSKGDFAESWITLRHRGKEGTDILTHQEKPRFSANSGKWECGGLEIEMREPFKKWKVSYNGWMKKEPKLFGQSATFVHVRFTFYWTALSKYFDFDADLNTALVAHFVAEQPWCYELFANVIKTDQQRFEQWGQLTGSLLVEDEPEMPLTLRGIRYHASGTCNRYNTLSLCGYTTHGMFFHIGKVDVGVTDKPQFKYGYIRDAEMTDELQNITWSSLEMQGNQVLEEFTVGFSTKKGSYILRIHRQNQISLESGICGTSSDMNKMHFTLNGDPGFGLAIAETPNNRHVQPTAPPVENRSIDSMSENEKKLPVVPIYHRAAECEALVGGKTTQLAHLHHIQGSFTVPDGVAVTTVAFDAFLEEKPGVKEAIERLNQANPSKLHYDSVQILFDSATVSPQIKKAISTELHRQFGDSWQTRKFAVRSSAIGEDSSDASSAGQMETILGVTGSEKILSALRKCWASAFTEQAIQYRKQNGQSVWTKCGVVIQEMVKAQVSGVLFTWDPVKSSPKTLVINASYGIGEAIVSGITEPDTISVKRSPNTNRLEIGTKTIGSKSVRILEDGSSSDSSQNGKSDCCLSDAQILQLSSIGVQLEQYFGSPRDLEWAMDSEGRIYLLQCRPVTGLMRDTDYQVMHEFDCPVVSSDEYNTTHNVGEVLGGVNSTLGISTVVDLVDKAMQVNIAQSSGGLTELRPERLVGVATYVNQALLNMSQVFYHNADVWAIRKVWELAVLGQPVEDDDLEKMLKQRYDNCSKLTKIYNMYNNKYFLKAWPLKEQLKKEFSDYKFPPYYSMKDPTEILDGIDTVLADYFRAICCHTVNSGTSAALYLILMNILSKGKADFGPELHTQVAILYSSCEDVESADVPAALQDLASDILKAMKIEKFDSMKTPEVLSWLQSAESGQAGKAFKEFLEKHGHRCINEIDLYEKAWSESPIDLIPVLQSVVKAQASATTERTVKHEIPADEAINKLNVPLSIVEKYALSWMVPWARTAVGNREQTKSLTIKVGHALRLAFRHLSTLLTEQGKLPDSDLLYYLTYPELKELVSTQKASTPLISRAQRRRKVRPAQESVLLDKIIRGYPQDMSVRPPDFDISDRGLKGTPVSAGRCESAVRVCKTLEDAKHIQKGEILVAHSTDIAWSVYFPLVSGVVTELGGLLSHGAVVAREYGLPCLVSVHRATEFFKTGDRCILDSAAGRISKVEN